MQFRKNFDISLYTAGYIAKPALGVHQEIIDRIELIKHLRSFFLAVLSDVV